jgi:hypothetical protein
MFRKRPAPDLIISAFTRVHSPAQTGVNALTVALWVGTGCPNRTCAKQRNQSASRFTMRARTKLVSETSLLEQFARGIDMVFSDEHPARQNADRAFKDAHVLIEHDMRNLGAVEQSLDGRD